MNKAGMIKLTLGALVLLHAAPSHAAPFGSAYFFGDSLTDCCNFGRFTNGGRPNWADEVAPMIGASYAATPQTDLAVGGAQSGYNNVVPAYQQLYGAQTGFLAQVGRFGAQGVAVQPNDIAGVWIGVNDIVASANPTTTNAALGPGTLNQPLGVRPSVAALTTYVLNNVRTGIQALAADGFQNILLLSPYDLGQSAILPDATSTALAGQYSTAIANAEASLYTPGVNTFFLNTVNLLDQVQANAAAYGFTHTIGADNCQASGCSTLPLAEQDTFIFNDAIHFTTAFDQVLASSAVTIVNADETIAAPVPEPPSAALAIVGLFGLALVRHRHPGR